MSFFFTRAKRVAKPKSTSRNLAQKSNSSSKEMLNRLGCKVCPLNKADNIHSKMQPDLADRTDVYFLSEMPSEKDDAKGSHESNAGHLLRSVIGRNLSRSSLDYVIRDYDASKIQPAWVSMECCRSYVRNSIVEARPKVIVGLGTLALRWMLDSSDMVGLRGRVFSVNVGGHDCYFIPTYGPDFIIQCAYDKNKPLRSKFGSCLKFDLERAFEVADWAPPTLEPPEAVRAGIQAFSGHRAGDLPAVLTLLNEAAKAPVKAIDLETYPLRPYASDATLLTVALSFNNTNFSFALNHAKSGWSRNDKKQIEWALEGVLSSGGKLVAHNAPFEIEWLIHQLGRETIYHDYWECTMMQSHFLDERRGKRGGHDDLYAPNPYQALNFLIKQYFGISYKPLFKLDRKDMRNADLDETLIYNAADTKYTLRLYKLQTELLKERGLYKAYREAAGRQPTLALMQTTGIIIDQAVNQRVREGLDVVISTIDEELHELPEIQKFELDSKRRFNVASQPELVKVLKDYVKVGKVLINANGKESTDKSVLGQITHPIAKMVENYRNCSKLKSTYYDPFELGKGAFIWPDARVHPSFHTTFAETGRTSCDEPNAQNWPARTDKWVRRQVIAPDGHVLVAFDYGQLEACTAAMCSKDKVLVKSMWEDYDIHMEWAIKAAHKYPDFIGGLKNLNDKAIMKTFRGRIKNKLVFPVIFGAKTESVAGYLKAPVEPVMKLMTEFWDTFDGVYSWQKRLMDDYYSVGYVQSPTGRRRHYPLTRNQAINYPVQSVACDIMCRAMVDLSVLALDTDQWWLHPLMTIHDDLTFVIPDDDRVLEESIETIYRVMLTPPYNFINVPLSVTASLGRNWYEMEEIGKYWSNRL